MFEEDLYNLIDEKYEGIVIYGKEFTASDILFNLDKQLFNELKSDLGGEE